jgi:CRP-like cAMP-binding protein
VISQTKADGEKSVVLELQRDDFQVLKERCQDLFKQYNAEYSSRSLKLLAHRELISQVKMFKGLGKQAALRLAAQVRQVTFQAGDALMHEGDEGGDEMFIVETGEVEVSIAKAGVVAQLGTGAAFGELALVTNEPRKATIAAVRPTTCLTLKKADFTAGALKDGEIGKVLKRQLMEYKRTTESKKREEQERQTQQVAADIASLTGSPAAQKL